jgi:hypothetical protein
MPLNLMTWGRRLFFPSERMRVLRIFITLKNTSPRPGCNRRTLGSVVSTLTKRGR